METLVYRPSAKLTYFVYLLTLLAVAALAWAYFQFIPDKPRYIAALPLLLFLIPMRMHIRILSMKLTLDDAHLVLETGLLSKTTRTLNVGKVQDVTVRQTLNQRLFGLGDLTVETAGEGSAMSANSFDRPKAIADRILSAAHRQAGSQSAGL